jgi:DNA-directed RNA polymerase specialized sigma24 family protein
LSEFVRLDVGALDRLSDEGLVAYVVAARAAGCPDDGKRAADILAYRLEPLVKGRVAAKIPADSREDVVMEVLESFLRSAFDGKVIDSVRAFVATIAKRRIADFYRKRERHPDQVPLPSEHLGDEELWGEEPSVEDSSAVLAIEDAVERVLDRRNELHRRVIMLYGPEPIGGEALTGAETVERMRADHDDQVSVDNVQQIWRRFKVELDEELANGEDEGDPDG